MKTLATLVQSLPPELYSEVYDLTFAAGAGEHHIDQTYKTPSCLHVNRSTRDSFARSYYGIHSTFWCGTRGDGIFEKWIAGFPDAHAAMLADIRIAGLNVSVRTQKKFGWEVILDAVAHSMFYDIGQKIDVKAVVKFEVVLEGAADKAYWRTSNDAYSS